jgi:hypothetical protein
VESELSSANPIEATLCAQKPDCRLESELWQADARGGGRAVVAIVHQPKGPLRRHVPPFRRHGLEAKAPEPCAAWETWLASVTPSEVRPVQLLVAQCAVGEHQPVLTDLEPYVVRYYSEYAPGVGSEYTFALDPPRIERQTQHGDGPTLTWDYGAFSGQECEEGYCAPVMVEASVEDDGFAKGGWKTTDLGECSMQLDSETVRGVATKATSAVRLLEVAGTLYVQVTDDAFVTKGAIVDEIVFRAIFEQAMSAREARSARLRMDGQLTDWKGNVRHVEMAEGPSTRRFALTDVWPEPEDEWHIAYEDTDDGRTRGQRLGNGQVPQEQWVFASPFPCVPRDGVLHVDRDHGPKADAQTALAP